MGTPCFGVRPPRGGALPYPQRAGGDLPGDLRRGESASAIARRLGQHRSTITREFKRNGGRDYYHAWPA
ncbi:MAG TPA: helix-turn-helix domain-containing protein [Actinomycetota bacterium]|nr:helix-turn-helix domain-containing protein [Actinomycetota bacterium]